MDKMKIWTWVRRIVLERGTFFHFKLDDTLKISSKKRWGVWV